MDITKINYMFLLHGVKGLKCLCGSGKGVITADVHPKVFDLSFTQLMPVQVYYQCHCFFSFLPVTAPNRNKFFRISERIVYISKWKIFLCL